MAFGCSILLRLLQASHWQTLQSTTPYRILLLARGFGLFFRGSSVMTATSETLICAPAGICPPPRFEVLIRTRVHYASNASNRLCPCQERHTLDIFVPHLLLMVQIAVMSHCEAGMCVLQVPRREHIARLSHVAECFLVSKHFTSTRVPLQYRWGATRLLFNAKVD
jgi:hypothetical protein